MYKYVYIGLYCVALTYLQMSQDFTCSDIIAQRAYCEACC